MNVRLRSASRLLLIAAATATVAACSEATAPEQPAARPDPTVAPSFTSDSADSNKLGSGYTLPHG